MRLVGKQDMISTAKVLVIDDNPETVELAAINLEMEGYEVYSASNGEEGLRLAEMMPDVILLDIMMPGIDGLEVCRRLKGNPQTRDILVIMLTARTTMEDILKGKTRLNIKADNLTFSVMERLKEIDPELVSSGDGVEMNIAGRDEIPSIARLLVENGCGIYELVPHRESLENLFINVVKGEE